MDVTPESLLPSEGYAEPEEYVVNKSTTNSLQKLILLVVAPLLICMGSLGTLLRTEPVNLWMVVVFGTILFATHELIHIAFAIARRQRPAWGFELGRTFYFIPDLKRFYIVVLNEQIERGENLRSIIGPFVILNFVAFVAALVTSGIVEDFALFGIFLNSAWSAQDLYNFVKVSDYPSGTIFTNIDGGDEVLTYVAKPRNLD